MYLFLCHFIVAYFVNISTLTFIIVRVRLSRGEMYIGHGRLCVSVYVCLSVPRRIPTLLQGPGCKLGGMVGVSFSYALLGGFAIGARVSLL